MSYRSSTDLDVASRALVMAGTAPINSFEDGTKEADTARLLYEDIAVSALTSTTWRFTIFQQEVNRLEGDAVGRWTQRFQIPADCLQVRALTVNGRIIPFERYGDELHTDHLSDTSVPVLDYGRRVPTNEWPGFFVPVVQHYLASEFAIAIPQNEQLSNIHAQKAEVLLRKARSIDAQGRTNSVVDTKRFIRTRRT